MNYRTMSRTARFAAFVSASVAAVGATLGFYEMTDDWLIAGLFGVGVAAILGLGWHMVITGAEHARRTMNRVFLVALGLVLFGVAIATSGWSLVTAVGGKSAITAYQVEQLRVAEDALTEAHNRLDEQHALVNHVLQTATATGMLAEEEGRTGEGPLFRSYLRTEENLRGKASAMAGQLVQGDAYYSVGLEWVAKANEALATDEEFRAAMSEIARHTTLLNGIDVTQDVLTVGMVGLNDQGLAELTPLTAELYEAAGAIDTATVDVPAYTAITRSEAVAAAGDKVLPAWIAAIGIDLAPLLFMLMVMFMANEPLIRQQADPKPLRDRMPRMPQRRSPQEIIAQEERVG